MEAINYIASSQEKFIFDNFRNENFQANLFDMHGIHKMNSMPLKWRKWRKFVTEVGISYVPTITGVYDGQSWNMSILSIVHIWCRTRLTDVQCLVEISKQSPHQFRESTRVFCVSCLVLILSNVVCWVLSCFQLSSQYFPFCTQFFIPAEMFLDQIFSLLDFFVSCLQRKLGCCPSAAEKRKNKT